MNDKPTVYMKDIADVWFVAPLESAYVAHLFGTPKLSAFFSGADYPDNGLPFFCNMLEEFPQKSVGDLSSVLEMTGHELSLDYIRINVVDENTSADDEGEPWIDASRCMKRGDFYFHMYPMIRITDPDFSPAYVQLQIEAYLADIVETTKRASWTSKATAKQKTEFINNILIPKLPISDQKEIVEKNVTVVFPEAERSQINSYLDFVNSTNIIKTNLFKPIAAITYSEFTNQLRDGLWGLDCLPYNLNKSLKDVLLKAVSNFDITQHELLELKECDANEDLELRYFRARDELESVLHSLSLDCHTQKNISVFQCYLTEGLLRRFPNAAILYQEVIKIKSRVAMDRGENGEFTDGDPDAPVKKVVSSLEMLKLLPDAKVSKDTQVAVKLALSQLKSDLDLKEEVKNIPPGDPGRPEVVSLKIAMKWKKRWDTYAPAEGRKTKIRFVDRWNKNKSSDELVLSIKFLQSCLEKVKNAKRS